MVSAYPAITKTEFHEAGKALQSAYTASRQVGDWIDFKCAEDEISIRQRRDKTSGTITSEPRVTEDEGCEIVEEFEQEDEELLRRSSLDSQQHLLIDFSIVLSQTYQVPVLWFSSSSIPATRMDALDRVYEAVVSPASRTGLREVGVLGGISIAEHPINGLPAFFIHPCRTQEALEVVQQHGNMSPLQYVLLWFGIIGAPVGLSVPSAVAKSISISESGNVQCMVKSENNDEDDSSVRYLVCGERLSTDICHRCLSDVFQPINQEQALLSHLNLHP